MAMLFRIYQTIKIVYQLMMGRRKWLPLVIFKMAARRVAVLWLTIETQQTLMQRSNHCLNISSLIISVYKPL